MLRHLFLSLLAVFALTTTFAQTFEEAVFVNKKTKTQVTFKKGQKVKVVWQNDKAVIYEYQGRLAMISQDTISLDRKESGVTALPLSCVIKIQRKGIPIVGWIVSAVGLLLMFMGIVAILFADFSSDGSSSTTGGGILFVLGLSLFMSGLLFVKHPSVNYHKEKWELRTEIHKPQQNSPKTP